MRCGPVDTHAWIGSELFFFPSDVNVNLTL